MSEKRMEAIALLGPLGSGKTTTLNSIINHVPIGDSYAVIVNDVGAENIDARRITDHPANRSDRIIALTAGCIGCSDVTQFQEAIQRVEEAGIDVLFIEPTGIAPGNEIMEVLRAGNRSTAALTLVNARNIERDLKWQVLPSQLAEAHIVGITHADSAKDELTVVTDALELLPPLDPSTALRVIKKGDVNAELLAELRGYGKQYRLGKHVLPLVCEVGCEHDAHDHDTQSHGIIAQSLRLRPDANIEELQSILLQLTTSETAPLIRAKGSLAGYAFDVVGDTWEQVPLETQANNVLNIIFAGGHIPNDVSKLDTLIDTAAIHITGDKKSIVKSINQALSREEREEIIAERLQVYPTVISPVHGELITDCEADEGYEIAFWGGTDDINESLKRQAMNAYISFRLEGLHEFLYHPEAIANMGQRADYWQRRFGATLGYNGYYLAEYISPDLLVQVREANPAALLGDGFMKLNTLTFDEGRAEEKPEFLASVFKAAIDNGDMTSEVVTTIVEHGIQLSHNNIAHQQRWLDAFGWLSALTPHYAQSSAN
jgi:G3E family GTPase